MATLSWRDRLSVAVGALLRGRDVIGDQTIEALKASGGRSVSTSFINYEKAKAPETRLEPLIKNGWRRNELIFACVSKKANTTSQVRLTVVKGKDKNEVESHPLRKLFSRPNPFMTESNFFAAIIILQDFAGAAYFEKIRSKAGRTVELWPIRPDWMKAYIGKDGMQTGWIYQPPGLPPHFYELKDVLAFRTYDPLNEYFGYPPVAVAARVGDLDNSVTDYVRMVFEKGGVPPGILSSTQPINEAIAERIRAVWREKYGGYANWDAPVVLGHDTKYQNTGLTFEQMGLQFLDKRAEVRICMTLKVPPTVINSMLGLERAVESNVKETNRNWWDNDLIPFYKSVSDVVRDQLLTLEYPDGLSLKWDFSEVPALQDDRDETRKLALSALQAGAITRNQFNSAWGLPDMGARGDVFIMGTFMVEVPISIIKDALYGDDAAEQDDDSGKEKEDEEDKPKPGKKSTPPMSSMKTTYPPEKAKKMRTVERKIDKALTRFLKDSKARVLESVEEWARQRNRKQDATQLPFWNEERQALFELLIPLFTDAITDEARLAFEELAGIADIGIAWDIVNEQAIGWANTQTSAVVSQITKTSMTGFITEFEQWVNSGADLPTLIESLGKYYDPVRAEMIAVTETTRAFAVANIQTWRMSSIVTGFDVLTAEDGDVDEVCLSEQSRNPHALDEEPPPYHVRCRCAVRPVVME